jgi:hypothetical protein
VTNTLPTYAKNAVSGAVLCTAAATLTNTAIGVLPLIGADPNGNGYILDQLAMMPLATVTATRADLWDIDTTGAKVPCGSITIPAQSVYTTQAVAMTAFTKPDGSTVSLSNPYQLAPGHTAAVAIGVAFATGIQGIARGYAT